MFLFSVRPVQALVAVWESSEHEYHLIMFNTLLQRIKELVGIGWLLVDCLQQVEAHFL